MHPFIGTPKDPEYLHLGKHFAYQGDVRMMSSYSDPKLHDFYPHYDGTKAERFPPADWRVYYFSSILISLYWQCWFRDLKIQNFFGNGITPEEAVKLVQNV